MKKLFEEWNIQYFTFEEVLRERRTGNIVSPPIDKWGNIKDTVQLADQIRKLWGSPVRCNSGYRSPQYNRLVGGASTSQHVQFRAMDLSPINGDIEEFTKLCRIAVEMARFYGVEVGFGCYNSFIHIDTGARNRNW